MHSIKQLGISVGSTPLAASESDDAALDTLNTWWPLITIGKRDATTMPPCDTE